MRQKVYFVGIKGTGTSALAELMHGRGLEITGSDTPEVFYTDAILKELGIPYYEGFDAAHIDREKPQKVVYSAAYSAETNPELACAKELGIPMLKYTDALGAYSAEFDSSGVAGVHGKTTTTAIAGTLLRAAEIPAQVLAGSAVAGFAPEGSGSARSTLTLGNTYFVAETCEYRRHFLAFHPRRIVLTSVESDHQDYYPTYEDIRGAFVEYCRLLPEGGELIYCADHQGAAEVARIIGGERRDLRLTPYGFAADGPFRVDDILVKDEQVHLRLAGFPETDFALRVPGRHTALDAAAALALVSSLAEKEYGGLSAERVSRIRDALLEFRGSRRRSEILGEAGGVLFMDDYGHTPAQIKNTLFGLKEFYPGRRLVLSFMSHTYTRTAAMLDSFAEATLSADVCVLHKIYASAREKYSGGVNGKTLYEKAKMFWEMAGKGENLFYAEEPLDAVDRLALLLKPGDLFISMGAGNNWTLTKELLRRKGGGV
jgi:UDP-N-acetylmuramate--alanine ligase